MNSLLVPNRTRDSAASTQSPEVVSLNSSSFSGSFRPSVSGSRVGSAISQSRSTGRTTGSSTGGIAEPSSKVEPAGLPQEAFVNFRTSRNLRDIARTFLDVGRVLGGASLAISPADRVNSAPLANSVRTSLLPESSISPNQFRVSEFRVSEFLGDEVSPSAVLRSLGNDPQGLLVAKALSTLSNPWPAILAGESARRAQQPSLN